MIEELKRLDREATLGIWEHEHKECDPKPHRDDPGYFVIEARVSGKFVPILDSMNRDCCLSPEEDKANFELIALLVTNRKSIIALVESAKALDTEMNKRDSAAAGEVVAVPWMQIVGVQETLSPFLGDGNSTNASEGG